MERTLVEMDPSDSAQQSTLSEEEKLPEGIDEEASWFDKHLCDESDNTVGTEDLNTQINQEDLVVDLDIVKGSESGEDKICDKDITDDLGKASTSQLLDEVSGDSINGAESLLLDVKKDDLDELKDIAMDSKKHDISNELKEMFDEKSSDTDEMHESEIGKNLLDETEITKEDKLKDIMPDDILGKDDSFDGLDNDALHQELEEHLTYDKNRKCMSELSGLSADSPDVEPSEVTKIAPEESESQLQAESDNERSADELNLDSKSELLKDLDENIETKEIDEIMEEECDYNGDVCSSKNIDSQNQDNTLLELADSCLSEAKEDDLENQLQSITGEHSKDVPENQEPETNDEIIGNVDKENVELNQSNMMVEFAHDDGNQVLIQINTDQNEVSSEQPLKSDSLIMQTSDGQTLVFSTETLKTGDDSSENDVSQVEGGAEFLEAVTGKLEDVLAPVNKEDPKEDTEKQDPPSEPAIAPVVEKEPVKEESPKCCISTCKSGKSSLKTIYRYFKPPVNKLLYKKWEYIFNQAKQQITPDSLICELHFRTGLIYRRGINKSGKVIWALREGALPKLSPSGILRAGGMIPPPSTAVEIAKRPDGAIKSPITTEPVAEIQTPTLPPSATRIVGGKKVLQKPVKTVESKVSPETTNIGFLYKNPQLVKVAQEEMSIQDILVCGECHSVFHILELFQAHKMANNCQGQSNFKGNPSEPSPPVWAFLLWKSAQAKLSDVESSWRLYQRWCKMDENIRNVWISAGKSLQEGHTIASLKLIDAPIKPNKVGRPPLRARETDDDDDDEEFTVRSKSKKPKTVHVEPKLASHTDSGGAGDAPIHAEQEPMELDNAYSADQQDNDNTLEDLARHTPELLTSEVEIKQEIMSDDECEENKENDSDLKQNKTSDDVQNCTGCKRPVTNTREGIICAAGCYGYFHVECTRVATYQRLSKMGSKKLTWKCDACKVSDSIHDGPTEIVKAPLSKPVSAPQQLNSKRDEEEFVVEKIVSRRYNIKKKHYEYLLKWEGYPSEQNTWEPAENLGTCQHLLTAFEEALAKQQAAKAAKGLGPTVKQEPSFRVKPPVMPKKREPPVPSTPEISATTGRPVRSSKKKAMDQVKVWCGSIAKPSEDNYGLKRKLSSDSEYEEEIVVKKVKIEGNIKMEQESEDSSDVGSDFFTTKSRTKKTVTSVTHPPGKPVMNGREANLAAALGLESDEEAEDDPQPQEEDTPFSQKSSHPVQKVSTNSLQNQKVLVASAKGVVKVDPKQVPNLSSGVYIMSNKSGMVKVDNSGTLNSLKKTGVMKKPTGMLSKSEGSTPSSGVVILPKSEASTPQQKVGVVRREPTLPGRPAGVLKPATAGRTCILPRPLGVLKTTTSTPPITTTPRTATPLVRPLGTPLGTGTRIQHVVRPKTVTTPARGRPVTTPIVRKPLSDGPNLQASTQQKLLIAKKKAEVESAKPSVTITQPGRKQLEVEASPRGMLPISSANKVLSHPMLSRGRGRGGFRGRGRGSALAMLVQREEPEPVKESKLVESDNLLMEFQEQSDSEESDDGVEDIFNIEELPPIAPESPPRELTLCPLTGKRLAKAEGEKTPEPTPPPSPEPPTPPPPPPATAIKSEEEPTHILPDPVIDDKPLETVTAPVTTSTAVLPSSIPISQARSATPPAPKTAIVKQDGMICKVEMSPGGTTGTLLEAIPAGDEPATTGVTEGTVTIKKPLASRNRLNRGPQLSVMPTNSTSTSLGTITVPARKLFQEENADDDLVTITGDDGMVYQVSNSDLTGNTLLVSSGEDGQQQCVYVTTDADGTEDGSTILTLDSAYADAVAQLGSDQVNILSTENGDQFYIKEGDDEGQLMALEGEEGMIAGDDQSGQVVAQLVEAGEPAPGGSRRVVLLLPDGNLMMTEVDEEQYAALDLDK